MLRVESVSVRFGGVQALDDVSIEVPGGTVTGLIGPNGAGKTTLFNIISGLQRPDAGRVLLGDRPITRLSPRRRAHLGLARTFQRLETFGTMTVRDNILVAAELNARSARQHSTDPRHVADDVIERLGLREVAGAQADTLPTGLARLVELGRALATEPSVLLLDEPSSGLNSSETAEFGDLLGELAGSGMGVLLVEHDIELVMGTCAQVWVLDLGRIVATGPPSEVRADPAVRQAYLGVDAGDAGAPTVRTAERQPEEAPSTEPAAPAALELCDVEAAYGPIRVLHGVSLRVPPGSVFALIGPNGAGKSTTLKVASGRLRATAGHVERDGRRLASGRAHRHARAGLCTVPEGRGVFPNLTVTENLQMWTFRGGVTHREVEEIAYARFPVLAARRRQLAGTLSGGEQQMLAMSRALATDPELLLLDEISMGLAPMIVAELYEVVALLAEQGIAIVVVEQSAPTALRVATDAAVLVNGKVALAGRPADIADSVLDAYMGGQAP